MTYAAGSLIETNDFNNFVALVNAIWSVGSGNSGYGQSALSSTTSGSIITAADWNNLLTRIANSASHQGTTLGSYVDGSPSFGEILFFEPNLNNNVTLVTNNRLNAATQGSTGSSVITNSSISWVNSLTMTWTITFASDSTARYFFNSGGQLAFTASHPTGSGVNPVFNQMASNLGTVVLSAPVGANTASIVGLSYTGVTKIGGGGSASVNTDLGFYSLTSSNQMLIQQNASGGYYANSFIKIFARYNGSGVLTIEMLWDEVPDGAIVSTGSVGSLTIRYPESVYISNTWGTPTITTSVTGS